MSKARLREIISLIFLFFTILLIGLVVIGIINKIFFNSTVMFLNYTAWIIMILLILELFLMIIAYGVYFFKNKLAIEYSDSYERDIPKGIPPAIASILLDFYVEDEQDYLATVSNLISKGYIEITNGNDVVVKNDNLEGLLDHEILAFNIVTKKDYYNSEEFRKTVLKDAKKLGLIERIDRQKKKWKYYGKIVKYIIIMYIVAIICSPFVKDAITIIMFMIIESIFVIIVTRYIYLAKSYGSPGKDQSLMYLYDITKDGETYMKKVAGLKKFFHEYTMMNEKELASIQIYDDYIPYAIALGEADAIEMFVQFDNNYRKLIYRV